MSTWPVGFWRHYASRTIMTNRLERFAIWPGQTFRVYENKNFNHLIFLIHAFENRVIAPINTFLKVKEYV